MRKLNRDIGSSFYELLEDDREFNLLKQNKVDLKFKYSCYYSGRNALLAILARVANKQSINTIWLPNYYCDTVINLVQNNFNNVKYYSINPFEFDSELDISAFTKQNDIIIVNNFWGLSSFNYINRSKERPIIIEDHSHGWLSNQSLNSDADYCFCSLRKTYPIPLGSIIWKPNSKETINYFETAEDQEIMNSLNKFSKSMSLKRFFIKNGENHLKEEYLELLNEGEELLNVSNSYIKPKEKLINQLENYICLNSNPIKEKHLKYIFAHLSKSEHFKIIQREGFTPFGLLLLFKDKSMFKSLKVHLISNQIYPAHLWPHNETSTAWKYLFNIHVDFRYDIEDMCYLVEKINIWSKNNV